VATYNCFLKEWTLAEWAVTGSIIAKETVEPTAPSVATLIKTASAVKNEGKFTVPTLAEGEKVIAATIHVYCKMSVEEKGLKFGFVSPAVVSEPTLTVAAKWISVSLTKAQAEALTQANLNELKVLLEHLTTKTTTIYDVYLSLETETSGTSFSGAITGSIGFRQSVSGQKVALGAATQALGLRGSMSGFKSAGVAVSQSLGFSQFINSVQVFSGAIAQTLGFGQSVGGRKVASSSTSQSLGLTNRPPTGNKSAFGTSVNMLGMRGGAVGFKIVGGVVRVAVGFSTSFSGRKLASGVVTQALALVQRILGEGHEGVTEKRAYTIYSTVTQAPRIALTVAGSPPASLTVTHPQSIPLTTQIE
jgi:hypothetical protein